MKYTPEEQAFIAVEYALGATVEELAKSYAVSTGTIRNYIHKYDGRSPRSKVDKSLKEEILQYRAQGLTQEQIAQQTGRSLSTIRNYLRRLSNAHINTP